MCGNDIKMAMLSALVIAVFVGVGVYVAQRDKINWGEKRDSYSSARHVASEIEFWAVVSKVGAVVTAFVLPSLLAAILIVLLGIRSRLAPTNPGAAETQPDTPTT